MSVLFRKTCVLDKRLKEIQRELATVDSDIRSLSKVIEKAENSGELPRLRRADSLYDTSTKESVKEFKGRGITEEEKTMVQDGRFVSYLISKGFQTARPLRRERRIQRNKAIVMCLLALLLLFLMLFRFFL